MQDLIDRWITLLTILLSTWQFRVLLNWIISPSSWQGWWKGKEVRGILTFLYEGGSCYVRFGWGHCGVETAADSCHCHWQLLLTVAVANCCCQLLLIVAVASCHWQLLLTVAVASCHWQLLLPVAIDSCCWQLSLPVAVDTCCCQLLLPVAIDSCCCQLLLTVAVASCCCQLPLPVAVDSCRWQLPLTVGEDVSTQKAVNDVHGEQLDTGSLDGTVHNNKTTPVLLNECCVYRLTQARQIVTQINRVKCYVVMLS